MTQLCAPTGLDLGAIACAGSNSTTSSISNTSLPTTSPTSPPSKNSTIPNPIHTNNNKGGLSGGAKAGIAVGVIIAVAIFAIIVWMLLKRRRRAQAKNTKGADAKAEPYEKAELPANDEVKYKSTLEMDGANIPPQELDSGPVIHELHGTPAEHGWVDPSSASPDTSLQAGNDTGDAHLSPRT